MNMEIKIFESPEFGQLRGTNISGGAWLMGADVARRLGYTNPHKAIRDHVEDEDKRTEQIVHPLGGLQETILINESGVYSLILGSKLPQAKEFKRWITSEVLPQIRQTGGYVNVDANDDDNTVLAKALLIAQRTIEMKNNLLEAQKPKVEFAEALEASEGSIEIGAMANILRMNGCDTGRQRLFKKLREMEYICKNSRRPRQTSIDAGLLEVEVSLWRDKYGNDYEDVKPMVTPKGQKYFIELFCKTN